MRRWRVGSISMGAALVLLGVFLLLSQFFNWDPAFAVLSWWPIIFIILGIEMIVYLAQGDQEKEKIQYDFMSIIFISFIGTAGIAMSLFQFTGLLEAAGQMIKAEVRTVDLPKLEETSLEGVKRISVDSDYYPLQIESTSAAELMMFGTYKEEVIGGESFIQQVEDYALIVKKGDTLYVTLKELPRQRFSGTYDDVEATLLVPAHIDLEINGGGRSLYVKPRAIESDWTITSPDYVEVDLLEQTDVTLVAEDVTEMSEGKWENIEKNSQDELGIKSATLTVGKGSHTITIKNANHLEVK